MWVAGGVPVNTVLVGTRTLVSGIVALALLPLLIARIGPTPAGLFVFASTMTGYFNAVEYGLGMTVTKYVAEHRATGDAAQLGSVLRASLVVLIATGLAVGLAITLVAVLAGQALFGAPVVRDQATAALLVAAIIGVLYWPSRMGVSALRGLERYDLCAVIEMAGSLLTFLLIYVATFFTRSVPILTALFGLPLVLEGVSAGVLAWPHLGLRRGVGRWRGTHLRPTLGFSAGMFLIGISDTLIYESDRAVIATFVGAAAIVVYEIALRPHTAVRLISGLIGSALLSVSARLAAQDRARRLRELVLVGSLYGIVLTIPFVVLVLLLARPIIVAWVGIGYSHYAVYVQIFVSYWLLGANTGVLVTAIFGVGRIRVFVWMTVGGAAVTLGLSIALAIAWGTVGVIWGTVIPAWLMFPIWMHYALDHLRIAKIRYLREVLVPGYLPIAAWAAALAVVAHLLAPEGIIGLGAFCTGALALLWLGFLPTLRERWRRMLIDDRAVAVVLT